MCLYVHLHMCLSVCVSVLHRDPAPGVDTRFACVCACDVMLVPAWAYVLPCVYVADEREMCVVYKCV